MPRLIPRLALALAAGGSTVGALELALRAAGVERPRANVVHPELGYVGQPGVEYWQGAEGGALVRRNSRGFRDGEWSLAKPPGVYRIAVLGDSYVAAHQVALEERFTERLEALLGEYIAGEGPSGARVEVLNFGVNGFGTAQELLVWRHEAARYGPDLVLLAFFAGNDLANNVRALEGNPHKAYFELGPGGQLVLNEGFKRAQAERKRPLARAGQRADGPLARAASSCGAGSRRRAWCTGRGRSTRVRSTRGHRTPGRPRPGCATRSTAIRKRAPSPGPNPGAKRGP